MKALRPSGFHKGRRTRNWTDYNHDAYRLDKKLSEPTICQDCGAVYQKGRWQWLAEPAGAHRTLCPACHRIHDDFPAGYVRLHGDFLARHHADIMHLVNNEESREKAEHPLQRIMKVEEQDDSVEITTTDNHLARAIGEAIHRAYQGRIDIDYSKEDDLVRINWSRDS